jgi:hypothetical protein
VQGEFTQQGLLSRCLFCKGASLQLLMVTQQVARVVEQQGPDSSVATAAENPKPAVSLAEGVTGKQASLVAGKLAQSVRHAVLLVLLLSNPAGVRLRRLS